MYTRFLLHALAGSMIVITASQLRGEEITVAYRDNFFSVKGFRVTHTNGEIREDDRDAATRQTFTFMSEEIDGELAIQLLEDAKTPGPDGKPGVLSMSFVEVAKIAGFCGFVYDGRLGDPITLANFEGEIGAAELKQVKVSFRYQAANRDESKIGAVYNCRFEMAVDDPYENRIDFGTLQATDEWQTFERTLSSGTNQSMFLSAVNRSPETPFRLAWGQEGEITSYDDGDTLLIDDIRITIER
jgi:hypothetical protein